MNLERNKKIQSDTFAYWLIVRQDSILLQTHSTDVHALPLAPFNHVFGASDFMHFMYLGDHNDIPVYTVHVNKVVLSPKLSGEFTEFRQVITECEFELFEFAAKAIQFQQFLETHKFCGRCGQKMKPVSWELANHCHKCHHRCYPRLSPCVIMAVLKGEQILLARGKKSRSGKYSVLAGFVEPGETLEQAVAREVYEETQIEVNNVQYFGSQPWPFPHQIMIGFTAEYAGGEIKIDPREILDAKWFDLKKLPDTPGEYSIAGQLIKALTER